MGVHFLTRHRNPLAYPAGYAPGFATSHPRSAGIQLSAVAAGGNYIDLVSGRVGTQVAPNPTSSTLGRLGPATLQTSTGNTQFVHPATAWPSQTMAAIVQFTGTTDSSFRVIIGTSAAATGGMYIAGAGVNSFSLQFGGTGIDLGGNAPIEAGVPYFFAASFQSGVKYSWVWRRLDSGELRAGEAATALTTVAGDALVYIGNRGTNDRSTRGGIAAVMHSTVFTSKEELSAWAADPWSFWYPNRDEIYYGASAAAPGGLFKITGNPRSLAGFGGGLAA